MGKRHESGRRIVLGHVHDARESASLLMADPFGVHRIVDALDPPSRDVNLDHLVAASVERVRRRFSSRNTEFLHQRRRARQRFGDIEATI